MSPGRASAASTISRSLVPAFAALTQVATPPQPPPSILCPDCCSDQVTNDAHQGLPGGTPAAARYLSTSAPVLVPCSVTPSWLWATCSAEAPSGPAPPPADAVPATEPGTADGSGASAFLGPAGG